MNVRDVLLRLRALVARRRVERELDDELAFHVERETHKQLADGLSRTDARARALARFGSVSLAADQCRDVRGVGLVDTVARDIRYACRTFQRAPLAALTVVLTVALGLGLVSVVFELYSTLFLRVDAVRSPQELFAVERLTGPGEDARPSFTRADYDAMRRETHVFGDAIAILRPVQTRIEGRRVTSALVTGNFFEMLGVQAAIGRPLMPRDDDRSGGRPVIVLSHFAWSRLFASDPNVIGREVRLNDLPFEIVGVMPEGFRGLGIASPDYWAPLALAGHFRESYAGREDSIAVEVVGRLTSVLSPEAATAGLTIWASRRLEDGKLPARPVAIKLNPSQGTLSTDTMRALIGFSPLFVAFGLILMIGCANVANLRLARGVSRQREIGVRLALGASRWRIMGQLLTEDLLLALAAAAAGLAASRLFFRGALYAATTIVPPELFAVDLARFTASVDWRVVMFLLCGGVVSTMVFGLAPASQATRLELVRTMRGEVTKDPRPDRARHALIAVQAGGAALLLIGAIIFLRGALAAATVDPGVRTTDTVLVPIGNEARRLALIQAVATHPSVATVAASSPPIRAVAEASVSDGAAAGPPAPIVRRGTVDYMAVSPEYFDVLGIDVVRGRGFTPQERTVDAGVVVVGESVARRLWSGGDALGHVLRLSADRSSNSPEPDATPLQSRSFIVVGVVRDVGGGLRFPDLFTFRGVYVPTSRESAGTSLTLRVRGGDTEQARQALVERLSSVDPSLGGIITMKALAGVQMYILRFAFWLTVVLGVLALVLTVSGLFSILSYVIEQRSREIGVRMALGATASHVVRLMLSQSLRPVGIGILAGGGLAAILAMVLTSASSEIASVVHALDPVAYAASGIVIAAVCLLGASVPALRAARIDPIATLRKD